MPFFRRLNLKDQHLSQDIRPDGVPALPGHPAQGLIAHGGEDRLTHVPLQRAGLEGYGLHIDEIVPIVIAPNKYNEHYLETKEVRMGHTLGLFKKK